MARWILALILICLPILTYAYSLPINLACTGEKASFRVQRIPSNSNFVLAKLIQLKTTNELTVEVRLLDSSAGKFGYYLRSGLQVAELQASADGGAAGSILRQTVHCARSLHEVERAGR